MPEDVRAVIEYFKGGNCPVNELISGIYSPEEAKISLDSWAANPGRIFRILIKFA